VFLLLPLFWIKSRPADVGQLPDGDAAPTGTLGTLAAGTLPGEVRFGQAMRAPVFWLLTVVTGVLWFCITGFLSSQSFYLGDLQFDPAQKGLIGGLFFGCAVIGKITFGFLSDQLNKRLIMTLAIGCLLAGVFTMKLSLNNPALVYGFAILYGIGYSAAFTMIQTLVAEYYRGRDYGSILGVVTMIDTLAGFAGVVVIGQLRKTSGSFDSAFTLMMALCAFALVATLFVQKPKAAPDL
jgi:MFS transporter, OFA family, oxalate/formate antiporter